MCPLARGASKNDAIAQVVADVFQAKVQRLTVSGSVALGASLRAASHQLGLDLDEMEGQFCKPKAGSTIEPKAATDAYNSASKVIKDLLGEK